MRAEEAVQVAVVLYKLLNTLRDASRHLGEMGECYHHQREWNGISFFIAVYTLYTTLMRQKKQDSLWRDTLEG